MELQYLLTIEEFCFNHSIEPSFIMSLHETGLIRITTLNDRGYIEINQLNELERFVRMHFELDINIEGIEAVNHLLNRILCMQQEIIELRNKLELLEMDNY